MFSHDFIFSLFHHVLSLNYLHYYWRSIASIDNKSAYISVDQWQ